MCIALWRLISSKLELAIFAASHVTPTTHFEVADNKRLQIVVVAVISAAAKVGSELVQFGMCVEAQPDGQLGKPILSGFALRRI